MTEQEEFNKWLQDAGTRNASKIRESAAFAGVVTSSFLEDPLCALQLGYAILLDKPLLLIVDKKTKVPASLVKIAKLIESVDVKNKSDMDRASKSIADFARKLPLTKQRSQ